MGCFATLFWLSFFRAVPFLGIPCKASPVRLLYVSKDRSLYEKKSKEKSDPTKGKKGGVDTRRMFDNVIKKYEKEYISSMRLPICEIQKNEVMKKESHPERKSSKKKRLIRRVK